MNNNLYCPKCKKKNMLNLSKDYITCKNCDLNIKNTEFLYINDTINQKQLNLMFMHIISNYNK